MFPQNSVCRWTQQEVLYLLSYQTIISWRFVERLLEAKLFHLQLSPYHRIINNTPVFMPEYHKMKWKKKQKSIKNTQHTIIKGPNSITDAPRYSFLPWLQPLHRLRRCIRSSSFICTSHTEHWRNAYNLPCINIFLYLILLESVDSQSSSKTTTTIEEASDREIPKAIHQLHLLPFSQIKY